MIPCLANRSGVLEPNGYDLSNNAAPPTVDAFVIMNHVNIMIKKSCPHFVDNREDKIYGRCNIN